MSRTPKPSCTGMAVLLVGSLGSMMAAESNLLANGGFEMTGQLAAKRLEALSKNGMTFDGADPILPVRWTVQHGSSVDMRLVKEAHSGQRALRVVCPKGVLELEMRVIEVVPGATYSFGVWGKGTGNGRMIVYGNAYEGRKELAQADIAFKPEWTETRQKVTIPGNIRSVTIRLNPWQCEQAFLDDAFFSAELPQAFDATAALMAKFKADEHTLLLVDFDGLGQHRLENGAKLTEENGGRFGKGVRLSKQEASTVVLPVALKEMPSEGTLEFWFSPDDEPEHIYWFLAFLAGDQDIMKLQADTSDSLRLCWRVSEGTYDEQNSIPSEASISRAWFHKGEWHHVAFQWDKEAVRFFVNGALAGLQTKQPQPFFKVPTALKLGPLFSCYAWSGVFDEVRLSDVQRYGPFVPVGAQWRPLVAPNVLADVAQPPSVPAKPAPDFAKERKTLISPFPPPAGGAVAFDASRMKPLLSDDKKFQIQENTPVPGVTLASIGDPAMLIREPDNDGAYWPLTGLVAGDYFVGVLYESSRNGLESPQEGRGALMVYRNGHAIQLATHSDPIQVAPGVYLAEVQSQDAVALKEGDEIAVLSARNVRVRIARLTLYSKEPVRGRGWCPMNFGANWFMRSSALGLNLNCVFPATKGVYQICLGQDVGTDSMDNLKKTDDGKAIAQCLIANPLPVPLTVEFRAEVKAYFREITGSDQATLTLQPHERVTRDIPFTIVPDSRRYTLEATAKAVKPPTLDWPAADTISFFPGVRQCIPWPDPFTARYGKGLRISGVLPGERQNISLNGEWQSAFTTALTPPVPPPADLQWQARQVPFPSYSCPLDKITPHPHGMYLRRKFQVPATAGPRTWRLLVKNVTNEATVFVNGQKRGNVRGVETPLLCDISTAVHPGENEVLIVVRDTLAVMDPAYVNPAAPVIGPSYLDAPGSGEDAVGVGDVMLQSAPLVTAEDALVNTSVRKKSVTVQFNVANRETTAKALKVKASVLDAGSPVLEAGAESLDLEPGGSKRLTFTAPWAHPVLWGPESPKLYTLAVELSDAATGQRLSLLRERFGFRESWIQGNHIMFNGAPVRLKGSTCQGGQGVFGGDDVQWSRGTEVPDFMDESGCPASWYLGGLGNTPSRHNVERDVFWETETQNVLAGAAQYANHACIIAWDLSNEWLSFLDYGGGDRMAGNRRFKAVADALSAYDPSRWIFFNGDRDLGGLHDTLAEHYMNPYYGNFVMRGHSPYLPDSRFWRELDKDFKPGEAIVSCPIHADVLYRPWERVIMNTENLWKVDGLMPPGFTMVADEDDVLSPSIDSGRGPIVWLWKQNLDGHRDLGASAVCNYTPVAGVAHRAHMLQCFIMPEHAHHGFVGQKLQRRYSLHNDLLVRSELIFRWSLVDGKNKAIQKGQDQKSMESGGLQRGLFALDLPRVKERTRFTLRLELLADGQFVYGEERDLQVWPDTVPPVKTPVRAISLFDPAGQTAPVFRKAGVPFAAFEKLGPPEGKPGQTVLVIGERAVQDGVVVDAGALGGYLNAGGRIVVLMQERLLPGLPVRTTLESREWCSILFLRTPQHPLLQGLSSWDLHFWAPDHVGAKGSYSRPDSGSFVTLIDGSGDHDRQDGNAMEWTQLLECYRGQGSCLLCQLPLAEKYDVEPVAREMLARVVSYAGAEAPFRTPTKTLKVVAGPGSVVAAKLRDWGVALQVVQPNAALDEASVMLVDAATLPANFEVPLAWKAALQAGATVHVHGGTPEQKHLLAVLADKPVEMTVQPYAMWEGRGYRNGFTWLTPGMSHVDLYWKDHDGWEGAGTQAEQPKYKIEDLCHYSIKAAGAVEHVFPGALVEIPVGKGRLIVDEIRWETSHKKLDRVASRVVSALLAGLNVALEPYIPPRNLPPDTVYKPIDLSAFCNRGLKDDVGDDGKGGWSDQGPKADLRECPTGNQNFGGVPFLIGQEPHCCIVLRTNSRPFPELQPDEATVPVGLAVEGLWFLHSKCYSGDNGVKCGVYQVQYTDGTAQEIELVSGENIRDWANPPAEFPRERGTRSRVAWTGSCAVFPTICVYQMLWVNPRPETPVKAVRFSNPEKIACPILMGLTAALKPGQVDLDALAAAQAKGKEWLQKGVAASEAGKDAEAREAFQQAIKASPSLDAAHQRLCELCEKMKDEDATLAACQAWAAAGARTPLPYNRIGAILERRKDEKGALEAYTKSLEIEWNQPPIIEAKSRLMQRLRR